MVRKVVVIGDEEEFSVYEVGEIVSFIAGMPKGERSISCLAVQTACIKQNKQMICRFLAMCRLQ